MRELRESKWARQAATIAMFCFAAVVGAFVCLHLMRPELDPVRHRLSEYAVGHYGYVMTTAFLAACIGLFALAYAFWASVRHSFWMGLACGAMLVAAAREGAMAVFVADPYGDDPTVRAVTRTGLVHDLLALTHAFFWSLAVGATPFALASDIRWRAWARYSFTVGAVVAACMAVRAFSGPGQLGLVQRLWIGAVLVWSLIHAMALRRRAMA